MKAIIPVILVGILVLGGLEAVSLQTPVSKTIGENSASVTAFNHNFNDPAGVRTLVEGKNIPQTSMTVNWTQQQKILASDGAYADNFGWSVSLSGNTALIGAIYDNDSGYLSGSAYVFIRTGTNWTQQAKLLASDGAAGDFFGFAVSLDGDTALIGAPQDDDNGVDSGSAYVFIRTGTTWTQQAKLLPSDGAAGDRFSDYAVALNGNTALIGAEGDADNGNYSGSAYVFIRTGTTWTQQQKLLPSDGTTYDWFGWSTSVSGNTALIGARGDDDNGIDSGSAYVFIRTGTTWTQQAKLLASDGTAGDGFGESASLSSNTALIGAFFDDNNGAYSGSAYVFTRAGTTWSQQAKLLASDGAVGDYFGIHVSLSGDTALIGAWGADDNGTDSGSAYIFTRVGTTWTQKQKLLALDGAAQNWFGYSVSLYNGTALIGAPGDDDYGFQSGSAYVFIKGNPLCGDANNDSIINVGDVVYLINYLFKGGPAPQPSICIGDCNGDSVVDVGDVIWLINYLFKSGPAPIPGCCG